jgi:hypothetical protein
VTSIKWYAIHQVLFGCLLNRSITQHFIQDRRQLSNKTTTNSPAIWPKAGQHHQRKKNINSIFCPSRLQCEAYVKICPGGGGGGAAQDLDTNGSSDIYPILSKGHFLLCLMVVMTVRKMSRQYLSTVDIHYVPMYYVYITSLNPHRFLVRQGPLLFPSYR